MWSHFTSPEPVSRDNANILEATHTTPDPHSNSWLGLQNIKKYFCSDKSWHEIIRASQLFKFQGLMGHVKDNLEDWHRFYDTADPLQAECSVNNS